MSPTTPHSCITLFALIGALCLGGCSLILDDPAAAPPPVCPAQGCEDGQTDNAQGGDDASNDNNQTGDNGDGSSNTSDDNASNNDDPTACDPACAVGERCFGGRCVAALPCAGDATCAGGAVCSDGLCRPLNGFPCDVAAGCPPPSACQQAPECITGICIYNSTDGAACDDGDPCTEDDTCLIEPGSRCIGAPRCTGVTSACSTDDREFVITVEKCDPLTPVCVTEEERVPCEGCAANCAAECGALSCDAPNITACALRGCVQHERFARCETMSAPEGQACLGPGDQTWSCRGGVCSGCSGDSASCVFDRDAPQNRCLTRECETTEDGEMCRIVPKDDVCDDGDPCTEDDACVEGLCVGTPMDCGGATCSGGRCVECQRDWDCGVALCNSIYCRSEVCVREPDFENWPCGLFKWCDNGSCR